MPKRPELVPVAVLKHGRKRWMVSVPPSLSSRSVRERRFFKEMKEAERFAKKLRGEYAKGLRGGIITADLAQQAARAAEILEPYGVSLEEAAKAFAAQLKAKGSTETFQQRFDRFTAQQEEHWRPRYRADMEKVPRWVGGEFMARRVAEITPELIDQALRANGAASESTVTARGARVRAVLSGKGKKKRASKVQIMTVGQSAMMLQACRNADERRAVAMLLFAGVRPSVADGEISRLEWGAVRKDHVYIDGDVSKTGSDRFVPISPRLRRLLRGHPTKGPVMPANWKRRFAAIRKAAGVEEHQDITRHTFASNFLAWKGEDATKAAMGHTAGSSTLFRHYRRAVVEEAGRRFFVGRPGGQKRAVVELATRKAE